ncbi:molybdate ABC transporter substrate-binding protein [Natronoflexus pectinivorans]|uniref:Molybdate transport system substrate-binding protein n=1 Tax=Natronoflexus pectinivorans TaxID=682526 RepID=A0A4R2GG05_9BACT|nr:molybdate ABC transporter substrate-binding protein [Natronoflexus pectinivorans]TCO07142.1 molybdate transport system substrate-binding protein [Natronoflexus pectinivorans]
MKRLFLWLMVVVVSIASFAQKTRIAAAADLRFAMDEIVSEFKKAHKNAYIEVIYGSSGNVFTQIINGGAPYDIYFSADISYPQKLFEAGLTTDEPIMYAIGRIVLWSSSLDVSQGVEVLAENPRARIAIANPSHAPYGERAVETLSHYGIYDQIKQRLIFGENIAQAAQFCLTGNAQVGILALSLALAPNMQNRGRYFLIDDTTHKPLHQGFVILNRAANNKTAQQFSKFITSPAAVTILEKYGFETPGNSVEQ